MIIALGASSAGAQAPTPVPVPVPVQVQQSVAPSPPAPQVQTAAPPVAPPAAAAGAQDVVQPVLPPPPSAHVPERRVLVQPGARPYPPPRYRLPPPILSPVTPEKRSYGDAGAPFSLGVGGVLIWRNEAHERFGNQKTNGGLDLFASYDLWAPARSTFVVSGGASYRRDRRQRTELADLTDHLLTAELTGRMRATSWLWPHVRAGVGVAITHVSVKDALADLKFSDRDTHVAGSFAAGFTLRTPTRALEDHRGRRASLSLGVMFEGGYTLAPDASLRPEPEERGDIRRSSPGGFKAETRGAFLRILGLIRF
jgi:hypothetical protein